MSKNPVVHFEMPYKDAKRLSEFYEKAFGWGMNPMGEEMGKYVVATTTPSDPQSGRPTDPGTINGGFFAYDPQKPGLQYPNVVISVDDIKKAMEDVEKAGGKVLGGQKPGEPDDIPGIGLYCAILDSEGNRVGLLEPSPLMSDAK
jgi:predicted enzyme related to lactoylglutathione lyase